MIYLRECILINRLRVFLNRGFVTVGYRSTYSFASPISSSSLNLPRVTFFRRLSLTLGVTSSPQPPPTWLQRPCSLLHRPATIQCEYIRSRCCRCLHCMSGGLTIQLRWRPRCLCSTVALTSPPLVGEPPGAPLFPKPHVTHLHSQTLTLNPSLQFSTTKNYVD